MSCPAERELLAFVSRSLPPAAAAELEVHLADCTDCRTLTFALVSGEDTQPAKSGFIAAASKDRIGRFEVVGSIGSGAMSDVYRALDPELGRHVAIKVQRGQLRLDVDGDARLRREAQALARLTHANVVTVYEAGRYGPHTYVAMEHVDGVTLDAWLKTPRSPREVIELLAGAGRGLAAAHAEGLVHRDVKPQNIFVSSAGVAKVGDFGLVRVERGEAAQDDDRGASTLDLAMTLSITGALVGTPAYMAPEQLRGEPATEASDQFSFCITLYEALYGRRPFNGETIDGLRLAMQRGPAIPARPRVPARVRRVLTRGLHLDPGQRFPSMTALVAVLAPHVPARWIAVVGAACAAAVAVIAVTQTMANNDVHCDAPDGRLPQIFGAARGAAIADALVAGNQAAVPAAHTVVRLFGAYGQQWAALDRDSCRATARGAQSSQLRDHQRACLDRRLQRAEDLGLVLSTPAQPSRLASATQAVESLPDLAPCAKADGFDAEPPPPGQAAAVAAVDKRIDHLVDLRLTGQSAVAAKQIDEVVAAARTTGYGKLIARALITQAEIYHQLDQFSQLEALLDEAAREAARVRDDEQVARAWTMRVLVVFQDLGRVDDARRWVPVAEAAVERAGNPPEERGLLHSYVASLWMERGEYARARAEMEAALALAERWGQNRTAARAQAHNDLAVVLLRQEHRDEARAHLETALALFRETYGELHPDVIASLNNLGAVLSKFDPQRALPHLEKARALGEQLEGPRSVNVAMSLNNMGIAHFKLGDGAAAVREFREAYAITREHLGPRHPNLAFALGNLGEVLVALKDYPGAVDAYRQAVEMLAALMGPTDVMLARARAGYGDALALAGDAKGAIASYQAALTGYQGEEADGPSAAMVRVGLAQLLLSAGDRAAACEQFQRAHRVLDSADSSAHDHAVLALAGVVLCDAQARRVDRERLAGLERMVADAAELEPEVAAFASYARAVTYAALGDRAKASTLATASRDGFDKAELPARRDEVDRWRRTLR